MPDLVTLNILNHFCFMGILMAHFLVYLPLKTNRPLAVLGCILILIPLPLYHFLASSQTPIYNLPLYVPLYSLYAVVVHRYVTVAAGFGAIVFTMATVVAHMHVFFLLIYGGMTQFLGFALDETSHLAARGVYNLLTLASLPLMRIYVRPHFRVLIEAVERQRVWLILLLSCSLIMLGNAMLSILLSRHDPVALRNCVVMAFGIVMFYYALYSFLTKESAVQRLKNQVESSERLSKTYAFYDAELREKESSIRALRHDFRHILLHLETLLKDKDYEGVARHLQSLSSRTAEVRPTAYCENMTVNTLVAYHFAQAREKGISCSSTLYVAETLAVPPSELAVIIGNALENSVKGAQSMEENGYIRFDAKPVKDCIVFDLENNFRPGGYAKGAGVGLSSIRELCEKNRGRAKVEDGGNGVFRLNIVLRLS